MRVFIAILLLVCICSVSLAEEYYILCKPEGMVNVRQRPKLKSDIVAVKYFGDLIITDGIEKNGFVHVINLVAEEEDGWIYKGLLVEDEPVVVNMEAQVFNGRVACRKYADGKLLRWLKDGTPVMVYATSQDWCYTEYGYIRTEFLTINAAVR